MHLQPHLQRLKKLRKEKEKGVKEKQLFYALVNGAEEVITTYQKRIN